MNKTLLCLIAASGCFVASLHTSVAAPALDAQGKCRDNGKFVAADLCKTTTTAATKCRDITTKKFAKCGAANTEPVPSKDGK